MSCAWLPTDKRDDPKLAALGITFGKDTREKGLLTSTSFPPGWTVKYANDDRDLKFFDANQVWQLRGYQITEEHRPYYSVSVVSDFEREEQQKEQKLKEQKASEGKVALAALKGVTWLHPSLRDSTKDALPAFPDESCPAVVFYEWDLTDWYHSFYRGCPHPPPILEAGYRQEIFAMCNTYEQAYATLVPLRDTNPAKLEGGRWVSAKWSGLSGYSQDRLETSFKELFHLETEIS